MTRKQLGVQAGLAVAALAAAYLTWQRESDVSVGDVVVIDASKSDIASVRYDDKEKSTWVELASGSDENGAYVAVRLSAQEKPGSGKAPTKDKQPERRVRGSETASKLFASFAPLRASRSLGVLDEAKLKDLGLSSSQKHITVALRGSARDFTIAPPPPGGFDPYLRDQASGQVYLAGRTLLSDFQAAGSALIERRLHGFGIEEVDRLVITHGSSRSEFAVSQDEAGVHVFPPGAPDKGSTSAKTWNDRVLGLMPTDVLGKDEPIEGGTPKVELRVDYARRGRTMGFVEIARLAAPAPTSTAAEASKDRFFARSERTLGWVELGADTGHVLEDAQTALR